VCIFVGSITKLKVIKIKFHLVFTNLNITSKLMFFKFIYIYGSPSMEKMPNLDKMRDRGEMPSVYVGESKALDKPPPVSRRAKV
jgi:hypothetical protein